MTKSQEEAHSKVVNELEKQHNIELKEIHKTYSESQTMLVEKMQDVLTILVQGKSPKDFEIADPKATLIEMRDGLPFVNLLDNKDEEHK